MEELNCQFGGSAPYAGPAPDTPLPTATRQTNPNNANLLRSRIRGLLCFCDGTEHSTGLMGGTTGLGVALSEAYISVASALRSRMYSWAVTMPSSFAVFRNASTAAWRSSG